MFGYIYRHVETPKSVIGGSWLYNIDAYRRLFPPEFIRTTQVSPDSETQFSALWGQFLDHTGHVKTTLARGFLQRLKEQVDLKGLLECFPYPLLRAECPIQIFYNYYGVQ